MADLLDQLHILKKGLEDGDRSPARLFDSSEIGACLFDEGGVFTRLNPAWEHCLGHTPDSLITRRIAEFVHPDDRRSTEAALALLREESTVRFLNRFRQNDGGYRTLEWVAAGLNGDGTVCAVVRATPRGEPSYGREVAGEAMLQSSGLGASPGELYRRAVEASPDAIIVTDLRGKILMVNEQAAVQNGLERPEELIGLNGFDFVAPEDHARAAENARITLETGSVRNVEYEVVRRDGTRVSVELSASLIRDREGEPRAFIAAVRDITERKRAALEQQAIEERYRIVYQDNPTMYFTVDAAGTVLSVNQFGAEQLRYDVEELLGRPVLDVFVPEDRAEVGEQLKVCLQNPGEVHHWEFRKVRKDGEVIWVREAARATADADGQPIVLIVCEDITESRRLEEQRHEIRERYRSVVETSPSAITMTDLGRTIVICNQQAAEMHGFASVEEMIGTDGLDLVAPEQRDEAVRIGSEAFRANETARGDMTLLRADGSRFPADVAASVVKDTEGRPSGFVAVVRDITAEREAVHALKASEERYRILYQDNPSMYFTVDAAGCVLSVNQFGAEQLGYELEELLGTPVLDVFVEEDKEAVAEQVELCLASPGKVHQWEFRKVRKDGRVIWVKEAARATVDADGQPIILIVCEDITEKRVMEEELQAAREALEAKVERQMRRGRPYGLTFRELSVLNLVSAGNSDRDIARQLGVSPLTVSKHVANVLKKMACSTRSEASARAVRESLVD
jgi:PAS domain S-box-containing protein